MSESKNELIVAAPAALTPVAGAPTTATPVQELISKPTIEDFAEQINKACQQTIEGIFKIADLCSEAMKAWPEGETTLVSLLKHMDKATFSRYRAISDDKRLLGIKDDLPTHYSTIYELTKLKGYTLAVAHAAGKITPKLLRKQAEDLVELYFPKKRRKRTNKAASVSFASASSSLPMLPSPPTAPGYGPVSVVVDWGYQKHASQDFRDWLDEGARKFGVNVLNRNDDPQLGSDRISENASNDEESE